MRRKRNCEQSLDIIQPRRHRKSTEEECIIGMINGRDYLTDLPLEVVMDIFEITGSTFRTISCCRCVCKSWRDMLSRPRFEKLHLLTSSMSPNPCILFGAPDFQRKKKLWNFGLLQCRRIGDKAFSSPPRSRSKCSDFSDISPRFSKLFALEYKFSNEDCYVSGSCNGLLLWWTNMWKSQRLYISNPFTKEYMALPKSSLFRYGCYSFGFTPETNQYKVIRLDGESYYVRWYYNNNLYCKTPINSSYNAYVHTIGTRTWRCVKEIPPLCPSYGCVFLNDGTLNWLGFSSPFTDKSRMIYSFHIETEQFRPLVSVPFHDFDDKCVNRTYPWYVHDSNIQLGLFGDSLCIVRHCIVRQCSNTEIWVLQKNHICWIKRIVMTPSICGLFRCKNLAIYISRLENGEVLFIKQNKRNRRTLVAYDPMNKSYRSTSIVMDVGIAHVPSLVSLKDVVAVYKEEQRVMDAPCKASLHAETKNDAFSIHRQE